MRFQWYGRPYWNSLVNIIGRWRQDFSLLSWHGTGNVLDRRPNLVVWNTLSPAQRQNNTTRGSTPGLVNPAMGPLSAAVPLPPRGPDEGFTRRAPVPAGFIGRTRRIRLAGQPVPAQQGPSATTTTSAPRTTIGGPSSGPRLPAACTSAVTGSGQTGGVPPQSITTISSSGPAQPNPNGDRKTRSGTLFGQTTRHSGDRDIPTDADDEDDEEAERSDRGGESRAATPAPPRQPRRPATSSPPADQPRTTSTNNHPHALGAPPHQQYDGSRRVRQARERRQPVPPGYGTLPVPQGDGRLEGYSYPTGVFAPGRQSRAGNDPFTAVTTPSAPITASVDPVTGARIVVRQPGLPQPFNPGSQSSQPDGSQRPRR